MYLQHLGGATLSGATQAETALRELYRSYLGRDPDADGFNWWLNYVGDVLDADERARWIYDADMELAARGSQVSAPTGPTQAEMALRELYANVLGRDPDEAGFSWWLSYVGDVLDEGEKAQWMAEANEELAARRAVVAPPPPSPPPPPVVVAPPPTPPVVVAPPPVVVVPPKPEPIYEPMTPTPVVSVPAQPTQAETALRQLYKDVLGRDPDLLGLNYWLTVVGNVLDEDEKAAWMRQAEAELASRMPPSVAPPTKPPSTVKTTPTTPTGPATTVATMPPAQMTQAEVALRQLYKDVLKRDPDVEGLTAWLKEVGPILDDKEKALWLSEAQKELRARGLITEAAALPQQTAGTNTALLLAAGLAALTLLG
jgi:hypothetical protein